MILIIGFSKEPSYMLFVIEELDILWISRLHSSYKKMLLVFPAAQGLSGDYFGLAMIVQRSSLSSRKSITTRDGSVSDRIRTFSREI